jgi:hypothetical protein
VLSQDDVARVSGLINRLRSEWEAVATARNQDDQDAYVAALAKSRSTYAELTGSLG